VLARGGPFPPADQRYRLAPGIPGYAGGIDGRVLGARGRGRHQAQKKQDDKGHTFTTAGPRGRFQDTARFSKVRSPSTMNTALIARRAAVTTSSDMWGSAGVSTARMPSDT
jgi:hypothetical protein